MQRMHTWLQPHHLARILLIFLTTILMLSPNTVNGQTTCEPPKLCVSRELHAHEVQRGVEKKCAEAAADSANVAKYRKKAADEKASRLLCIGRLKQIAETPPTRWRSPWWLRLALDVSAPLAGGAGGACLGLGCPESVSVGVLVAGAAMVVGRVVLEVLDDR